MMRIRRSLVAWGIACTALFATGAVASIDSAKGLLAEGELQKALESLEEIGTEDVEVRFLRGVILAEMDRDSEAERLFRALIRDYPEHPEPYNNLAVLLADAGRYDEAVETLKSALRTHPSYRTAWDNLTTIYGRLASEAYSRALDVESGGSSSPVQLALLGTMATVRTESMTPVEAIQADVEPGAPAVADMGGMRPAEPLAEDTAVEEQLDEVPVAEAGSPEMPLADEGVDEAGAVTDEVAEIAPVEEPDIAEPVEDPGTQEAAVEDVAAEPASEEIGDAASSDTASPAELSALVQAWAGAWSGQRVDDYLSFYSSRFTPQDDMGLEEWKALRRSRLQGPEFIQVDVALLDLTIDDGEASVTFNQSYESNTFGDVVTKTLDLVREDNGWKIVRETVAP